MFLVCERVRQRFRTRARVLRGPARLHHPTKDTQFGYASFATAEVGFAIARTDDANLVGRHTGVGFGVKDLIAAHRDLAAKGVDFWMPPEKQPWGGFMAMFRDPDGNSFYLDQLDDRHADH